VSSLSHESGKFDLSNMHGEKSYDRAKFYANSKLYQVMMMYSLERRLKDTDVSVYSLHPGAIQTNISKNFEDSGFYTKALKLASAIGVFHSDIKRGAATSILLAVTPHIKDLRGYYFSEGIPATPSQNARNVKYQEVLWQYSMDCVKDYLNADMLVDLQLSEEDQKEIDEILTKNKKK
jgi:retinol dehydrogenase-12